METLRKILFKESVKTDGFESLSLAELIAKPKDHDCYRPHRITFNWIFFITVGSVNHMVDFKTYKVEKNECLVISQNQIQSFDPNSIYIGYAFLFTNDYLHNHVSSSSYYMVNNLFNYHASLQKHSVNKGIISDIDRLSKEFNDSKYSLKFEIIKSLFSVVLLKLSSLNQENLSNQTTKGFQIFEQFRFLVEKDYAKSRNVKFHIKTLGVSHKHLNEICKRFTRKTAKEFIDYFIILEIKRKLSSTNSSIKNICYDCGFDETTNFQKYFKKHTGVTVTKFRTEI